MSNCHKFQIQAVWKSVWCLIVRFPNLFYTRGSGNLTGCLAKWKPLNENNFQKVISRLLEQVKMINSSRPVSTSQAIQSVTMQVKMTITLITMTYSLSDIELKYQNQLLVKLTIDDKPNFLLLTLTKMFL